MTFLKHSIFKFERQERKVFLDSIFKFERQEQKGFLGVPCEGKINK